MKKRWMLLGAVAVAGLGFWTWNSDPVQDGLTGLRSNSDREVEETEYPEQVFWGDTHLHTANSPDAFGFGNRLPPEDALRFARG